MVRRVGDDKTADEAVAAVDAEVVLVAEHRHHDLACGLVLGALGRLGPAAALDGPAPVAVDLAGALSTGGQSGLGLEAQRASVQAFVASQGWTHTTVTRVLDRIARNLPS